MHVYTPSPLHHHSLCPISFTFAGVKRRNKDVTMSTRTTDHRRRRPVTVTGAVKEVLINVFFFSASNSPSATPTATRSPRAPRTGAPSSGRASNGPSGRASRTTTITSIIDATQRVEPTSRTVLLGTPVRPAASRPRYPSALPTVNFYERFPAAVGPMGNVVVTAEENDDMLLLINESITVVPNSRTRNVQKGRLTAKDVAEGGFLVYQPCSSNPQYFTMLTDGEGLYGSSVYICANSCMQ